MKNEEKRHALSVLVTDIEFADSKGAGKDTVSAKGQSAEPETYDADSVLGRTECTFVAIQCGKSPSCSSSACYSR